MKIQLNKTAEVSHRHMALLIKSKEDIAHPVLSEFAELIENKLAAQENETFTFYTKNNCTFVVIVKNNAKSSLSDQKEKCRQAGGKLFRLVQKEQTESVLLTQTLSSFSPDELIAVLEGFCLAQYQFNTYKSGAKTNPLQQIMLNHKSVSQQQLDEIKNVLAAATLAKDIINEPVIHFNSVDLGNLVLQKSTELGFSAEVLQKDTITSLGMGGLLGVNRGSTVPPTFSILTYKPAEHKNAKPFIIIGKGVTYDTGGYSLKPANVMGNMKSDMSGAAAVLGTIMAVAANKLPVYVIGLIPSTDNRIGTDALVPDDIIRMSDGTTVEVQNTDAEGRLILADALHYAKQFDPELVIDLATLTGAAAAITGHLGAALMGTDTKYRNTLIESGLHTFERVAEIPFWNDFSELLKSDVADLRNIGGPMGGASTAGKFLEHFTAYPWLHLDIAGPAFLKEENGYKQRGGSAFGVRLLYHFLSNCIS